MGGERMAQSVGCDAFGNGGWPDGLRGLAELVVAEWDKAAGNQLLSSRNGDETSA